MPGRKPNTPRASGRDVAAARDGALDRHVGDAFDNALAETTIGLYKHECVRADSPFRRGPMERLWDLEMITAGWVHWYKPAG